MQPARRTFLVHVLGGGGRVVIEDVATRERTAVADVAAVSEQLALRLAAAPDHARDQGEIARARPAVRSKLRDP